MLLIPATFFKINAHPIPAQFQLERLKKVTYHMPEPSAVLWTAYWKAAWGNGDIDFDEIRDSVCSKQFVKKYEQCLLYLSHEKANRFIATKYINDLLDLSEEIGKSKRIPLLIKDEIKKSTNTIIKRSEEVFKK